MTAKTFRDISGIFILDKPLGISSHQALQQVRHIFNAEKAGHTGSLDVLASGLLPICFGEATKFTQVLLDSDKHYRTVAVLGKRTTTCDAEGAVVEERPAHGISLDKISRVLEKFVGEIEQIPSMFSALKHQGRPLYELARKGIEVERKPRKISIHKIKLLGHEGDRVTLDVWCSKGTYIRNLVDDIGQALGCGAYVGELRRLGAGLFNAEHMISIERLQRDIEFLGVHSIDNFLLPIESSLAELPVIILTEQQVQKIYFGQPVMVNRPAEAIIKLKSIENVFIGIGEISATGCLTSKRLLNRSK
jgi:tRNA pseudouridine55 synthase